MTSPQKRVAFYDDPVFRLHDAGEGHPERPERLDAVGRGIREAGMEDLLLPVKPRPATRSELLRVHTEKHVLTVASTKGRSLRFDADTQAGPHSYEAALLAAGAVVDAVDRVLAGEFDRAFCAVRPPGHHAEADRAMGFCLFNNVAVGAAHALSRGLSRIMVVDCDVHHGNGTQDIFYEDPRVLYVSSHAYPFYPGTGALEEVGRGPGVGFTVNLPLPDGMGDPEYHLLYHDIVAPVGEAFRPELVLCSLGFDPYIEDPLAGMRVTERGFADMASVCLGIAGHSGTIFVLEGGYHLDGMARSAAAVVGVLGELSSPAPWARPAAMEPLLSRYRRALQPYWPALA